ncbi:MAG TPA: type II toxin-antitoxin system HicA family toxin [Phycisphaerales bacterium]|nr:type II toxin-antitoxin system HicA family toxin [Phycisphaerales bacterium]
MPGELRFADIRRFLEHHGYTLQRISGSHHIFGRPNSPTISIPVHKGRAKPIYIRQIERTLGVSFK